jgi:hypothetical protein
MRFSLPIKKLFQLTKDFRHTTYKDIHEEAPRYTALEWACIEGGHDLRDLQENISVTGTERAKQARAAHLEPGTDAWFKHWFSRPKLTREEVDFLKQQVKGVKNEKASRLRKHSRNRGADERGCS